MYKKALQFLQHTDGLDPNIARSRLNITIQKLNITSSSAEDLARAAFRNISASEVIVNKSAGGRSGIAVMTESGASHGEENRQRNRNSHLVARGKLLRSRLFPGKYHYLLRSSLDPLVRHERLPYHCLHGYYYFR